MINESVLRDVLIALADENKSLHLKVSNLTKELSVLRETLSHIDRDGFDGILKRKTEEFDQRAAGDSDHVFPSQIPELYDEIIRRLRVGEVC
jgi:hypothetical protein